MPMRIAKLSQVACKGIVFLSVSLGLTLTKSHAHCVWHSRLDIFHSPAETGYVWGREEVTFNVLPFLTRSKINPLCSSENGSPITTNSDAPKLWSIVFSGGESLESRLRNLHQSQPWNRARQSWRHQPVVFVIPYLIRRTISDSQPRRKVQTALNKFCIRFDSSSPRKKWILHFFIGMNDHIAKMCEITDVTYNKDHVNIKSFALYALF